MLKAITLDFNIHINIDFTINIIEYSLILLCNIKQTFISQPNYENTDCKYKHNKGCTWFIPIQEQVRKHAEL